MGLTLGADLIAVIVQLIDGLGLEDRARQGDDGFKLLLVESEHIACRHPCHAGKDDADAHDEAEIHDPAEAAASVFMALAHWAVVPLGLGVARIIALLLAVRISKETVDLLYRVLFIFRAGLRAGAFPIGALRRRGGLRRRVRAAYLLIMDAEYLIDSFDIVGHGNLLLSMR